MGQLLLGIDVGTYSSKGVLVDPSGSELRSCVTEHTMDIPQPGWAEQDADKVWWADVVAICHALLDGHAFTGDDVGGVAISAIGPCMLPLDAQGNPLRAGILYGVDTRASAEIDEMNRTLGEDTIFEFSNMALSSQAVGPKILWLKHHEPQIWAKVDHITTASSYLIYKLSGEKVIDRHTASHFIPLMDKNSMEWSDRFAGQVLGLDKLPRLGWSDEQAGEINVAGSKATGLKVGTPLAVGAVDALSEAISVGATRPGDLMIMYGSTAFFILVQSQATPDRRMWSVAGAFEGQHNLAAGMSTAGSLTRWFRDELALELPSETAYNTLFERAEAIAPGSDGLLMLPYFSGERTPINDLRARGVIAGLSLAHTRDHLFRAVLEGVAYGIRHNIETFQNIGAQVHQVIAVGGGTKSRIWLQIVSDVAGIPQMVTGQTIGASYGDAFLAGVAAGILKKADLTSWVRPGYLIEPNPARHAQYEPYYQQYHQLYENTRSIIYSLQSM